MKSTIGQWFEVPAVFKGFKLIQLGDRFKDKIIVKRNSKQSWDPCVEGVSLFCHVSSNPIGASFAALGKRRSCRRVASHVTKKNWNRDTKTKSVHVSLASLNQINECRVQLLYKLMRHTVCVICLSYDNDIILLAEVANNKKSNKILDLF